MNEVKAEMEKSELKSESPIVDINAQMKYVYDNYSWRGLDLRFSDNNDNPLSNAKQIKTFLEKYMMKIKLKFFKSIMIPYFYFYENYYGCKIENDFTFQFYDKKSSQTLFNLMCDGDFKTIFNTYEGRMFYLKLNAHLKDDQKHIIHFNKDTDIKTLLVNAFMKINHKKMKWILYKYISDKIPNEENIKNMIEKVIGPFIVPDNTDSETKQVSEQISDKLKDYLKSFNYRYQFYPSKKSMPEYKRVEKLLYSKNNFNRFILLDTDLQRIVYERFYDFGYDEKFIPIFNDICTMNIISEIWKIETGYYKKSKMTRRSSIKMNKHLPELDKRSSEEFKNNESIVTEMNFTDSEISPTMSLSRTRKVKIGYNIKTGSEEKSKYYMDFGNIRVYLEDAIPSHALKKDFPEFTKWISEIFKKN